VTDDVAARVVVLPTGTAVGEDDIAKVCAIVREAVANPDSIRARLRS
jgi:hypothetical protein